jgi:hypothetical protein
MQTELTTTPHPHDPHADDLTWSQARDMLRYFGTGRRLEFHVTSPHWVTIFENHEVLQHGDSFEDALRSRNLWPDQFMCPPAPRFTAIQQSGTIMRGTEYIATAASANMARRIANALNFYKPGKRGH